MVTVEPQLSVTVTVNVRVPAEPVDGVPVIVMLLPEVLLRPSPHVERPEDDQVYGVVPPLATKAVVDVYKTFSTAAGDIAVLVAGERLTAGLIVRVLMHDGSVPGS
ncbi:MAG: hypothetical protein STSR0002_10190 [Smithella sp.]